MAKTAQKGSRLAGGQLEPKLARVVAGFQKLSPREQRRFANVVSNELPTNPKLGNSSKESRGGAQRPATSQAGKASPDQSDYFRKPRNRPGQYTEEPDASITPGRVTTSVRMRNNPIKGLTFEKLVNHLDQWRLGFFRGAGMAWDTMERRDYQLQICRPKRLKSVARHGYDILIRDDVQESQQPLAQAQKDFLNQFYGNASATTALNPDEEGGFSLLVRQMMDAVGKYYAIHEIIWQPLPDGTLTAKFIFCPIWWFEGTRGKLRFLPSEFQIYGNEMLPGEWMVTCGDGIMEACSVVHLMKSLVLKSALAFLDKFGMPGIHGKTDAAKDSPEWNDFVSAVQDFAQEWSAVTNRNADLTLVEAKANGEAGFKDFLAIFDRAITQLWRGADLGTTSSAHGTGASLQEDESEILETDDAKNLEETLESKVTKYALAWKFGPDAPALAYIKLRTTPRRNIQDDLAVDTFLSTLTDKDGRGLLGLQTMMERYSRPLPKPDEDVVEVTAPATTPGKEVPPGETDKNPEFSNTSTLNENSQALLVEAVLADFQSINERLAAVAQIDDAAMQKQKLATILDDLAALKKNLDHDPAVANAIYKILAANLANGIAEKTKS
jgi:phage gp29-like protein